MTTSDALAITDPALQMLANWLDHAEQVFEREFRSPIANPPRLAARLRKTHKTTAWRLDRAWRMIRSVQIGMNDNVPGFRSLTNIGSPDLPLRRPMDLLRKWALAQAKRHTPRTRCRHRRFRSRPRAAHQDFWIRLAKLANATDHCSWLEWAVDDNYARAA